MFYKKYYKSLFIRQLSARLKVENIGCHCEVFFIFKVHPDRYNFPAVCVYACVISEEHLAVSVKRFLIDVIIFKGFTAVDASR